MRKFQATGAMLAFCAAVTIQAHADDASKKAKVEELFTVMHVNRMSDQITSVVRNQLEMSMRGLPGVAQATPEQKKLLTDYETKVMNLVQSNVNWKVIEPQMVTLYGATYTEGEIDGILAFYKSPVGQTMLAKSPELTQKSMELTQGKLAALQPQISAISQDFAKRYQATEAPAAKPGAPGPSAKPAANGAAAKPGAGK